MTFRKPPADIEKATGIAYSFVLLAAGLGGLGRHIWDIQATDWPKLAKVRPQYHFPGVLPYR